MNPLVNSFLYQPVKPFFVTQLFGVSDACVKDSSLPISQRAITSKVNGVCPTGYSELYPLLGMKGHTGLDLVAKRWQPVYASLDGRVEEVETEVERGLGVGVITDKKYFCNETNRPEWFKYRNWHFIGLNVHRGDYVRTGELLGWADSTGLSSGDHVHFEVKPVAVNTTTSKWYNLLQDNGYFGAINPLPYVHNTFALNVSTVNTLLEQIAKILDAISDTLRGLLTKKDI